MKDHETLEAKIFYFKEGVVTNDVENERKLAIEIIDMLQSQNKTLLNTLFLIREQCKAGISRPVKIARLSDQAIKKAERK